MRFGNDFYSGGKILTPVDTYPFSERYGWLEDKYSLSWQVIYAGGSSICQKLPPTLMFVGNVCGKAEEAINFYASVFKNAPASRVCAVRLFSSGKAVMRHR